MLVLTRSPGEGVVITVPPSTEPTRITMTTGQIEFYTRRSGRVRLVFSAPLDVAVNRSEVQDRIDAGRPAPKPQPEK